MAISFVAATRNVAVDTNGGTMSCTKPSGTVAGDVMIAFICNYANIPSAPSGWEMIRQHSSNGLINISAWYKVAGGSEPASYAFTSGAAGRVTWGIGIQTYRGVDPVTPIRAHNGAGAGINTASLNVGSVTTTDAEDWLVWGSAARNNGSGGITSSSSDTERTDSYAADGTAFTRGLSVYDSNGAVSITTHNRTVTWSTTVEGLGVIVLALAPAGAPPAPPTGWATISYVSSSNVFTLDSNGSSQSCNKPAGVLPGDTLIAFVTNYQNATGPAGWERIRQHHNGTGPVNLSAWYKVAGTSEPGSYSWGSGTSGSVAWGIAIHAYRNADPNTPIGVSNSGTNSSSTSISTQSITPTTPASWVVYASGIRNSGSGSARTATTGGGGHSERTDAYADASGDFIRAQATYDSNGPVAESSQSYTMTWSSSCTGLVGMIVELKPAPSFGSGGPPDETPVVNQITERFQERLYRSHEVISYVDVTSPTGITQRLLVTEGSIDVDRTAETRRRCTLKCIDPTGTITPKGVEDILTPYGTEIRPYRGIVFSDAPDDYEAAPLGVFRISKVDIADTPSGVELSIEASDLSRTVARDKFTSPYTVEVGVNLITAIKQIVERTFAELSYNFLGTARVIESARVYDIGDDPWEAMVEIATSLGYDIYFDIWGQLTIVPFPDIENLPSPTFEYVEGENCTMLGLTKVLSDSPGYNGVVVLGEAPSDEAPAVMGIAWDEDPTSATYYRGPYGAVPMFHQDQLVKTDQDANDTADALLKNQLGFASGLQITALPNPLFECGDVVRVKRARTHVDNVFVIDAFNIPLRASATQELTLRQKR